MKTKKAKLSQDSQAAWRNFVRELRKRFSNLSNNINKLDSKSSRRSIHRLRVLSRRLRAMLAVLKVAPKKTRLKSEEKAVKKLTRALSPIRSLDVSAGLLEGRLRALSGPDRRPLQTAVPAIHKLRREARRDLAKTSRGLRAELGAPDLDKLKEVRFGARFLPALRRELRSARSRAARRLREYRRAPDMHRLHEFRIALKKYRYLLEIHAEVLRSPDPALRPLKALQDHIGAMHDLEVLRELLQDPRVTRRIPKKASRRALVRFEAELASEVAALEKSFLSRQGRRLRSLFPNEVP